MTGNSHTLPVRPQTILVRVEQAQDGGDHGGFLAERRCAEDVVATPTPGDADDHAAGGLDGLQVAGDEHRKRVLPQAEAKSAVACHAPIHAGRAAPPSGAALSPRSLASAGWDQASAACAM